MPDSNKYIREEDVTSNLDKELGVGWEIIDDWL